MAGMTDTGFEKITLDEIKAEIEDSLRSTFGSFINLLPGSIFALLIGIFAEREADIWDAQEEAYFAMYPNTANGISLDNAVTFNGITRLGATKSRVPGQLFFGDEGTLIAIGTKVSVNGNPQAQFETTTEFTLIEGTDAVQTLLFSLVPNAGTWNIIYGVGDDAETTTALAFNASAADVQVALRALVNLSEVTVTGNYTIGFTVTFAGADGKQPHPQFDSISNVTASLVPVDITTDDITPGVAQGTNDLIAVNDGPTDAPLNPATLTVIDTPVSGLTATKNVNDVILGRLRETDAELRQRRANTLSTGGNATIEAILARLRNIAGVVNVTIFENETMFEDGNGLPPKSYEAVVDGGDEDEIAEVIWNSKPAGIETHGNEEEIVIDSMGVSRTIKFSRPNTTTIYISIDLSVDGDFPANGAAQAQSALVAYGATLNLGADIIVFPKLVGQLASIPGITDLRVRIGTSPVSITPGAAAVDDNITIAGGARAQITQVNTNINVL